MQRPVVDFSCGLEHGMTLTHFFIWIHQQENFGLPHRQLMTFILTVLLQLNPSHRIERAMHSGNEHSVQKVRDLMMIRWLRKNLRMQTRNVEKIGSISDSSNYQGNRRETGQISHLTGRWVDSERADQIRNLPNRNVHQRRTEKPPLWKLHLWLLGPPMSNNG